MQTHKRFYMIDSHKHKAATLKFRIPENNNLIKSNLSPCGLYR